MLIRECPNVGSIRIINMFMFKIFKEIKSNINFIGYLMLDKHIYKMTSVPHIYKTCLTNNPKKVSLTTGAKPAFRTTNSLSPCAFTNQ